MMCGECSDRHSRNHEHRLYYHVCVSGIGCLNAAFRCNPLQGHQRWLALHNPVDQAG